MENGERNEVLLDFGSLWLRNDSVLQVQINPGVQVRYHEARKLMETIRDLSRFTRRPVLLDLRGIKDMDTAARFYFLGERAAAFKKSMALIVSSPTTKWLANLSLFFSHPACPTRVFMTEEAALHWSMQYLPSVKHTVHSVAA